MLVLFQLSTYVYIISVLYLQHMGCKNKLRNSRQQFNNFLYRQGHYLKTKHAGLLSGKKRESFALKPVSRKDLRSADLLFKSVKTHSFTASDAAFSKNPAYFCEKCCIRETFLYNINKESLSKLMFVHAKYLGEGEFDE